MKVKMWTVETATCVITNEVVDIALRNVSIDVSKSLGYDSKAIGPNGYIKTDETARILDIFTHGFNDEKSASKYALSKLKVFDWGKNMHKIDTTNTATKKMIAKINKKFPELLI